MWTQTNSRIDDADLESDPRLKYVPASVRAQWDPAKLRENTSPEELAALKAEAARDVELVKAMHERRSAVHGRQRRSRPLRVSRIQSAR